jgi:uncharacterized protein (UPF0264 family)
MRLLISVRDGAEASAALAGGADLIDAKDPAAGSLGAVALQALMGIHRAVGQARPVTAALGDAATETTIEQLAFAFASAGTAFVKVGFAGISDRTRVSTLLRAAVHGARSASGATCGVIAVGYADSDVVESLPYVQLNTAAAAAGAAGVLIDTADKQGPGLPHLINFPMFSRWCREAHDAGFLVAAAGRLTPQDLPYVRDAGVDIVGFRGAACDGGRTGHVSREKVSALHELVSPSYVFVDQR